MPHKPKLVVVEDEPDLVEVLVRRLEAEGFDVIACCDGQEALEKIRSEKPDLILLDVMIPKVDGYQVCRELKKDAATRDIPVLVLTVRAMDEDAKRSLEHGAAGHLIKPFDHETLLSKIRECLNATA